MRHALHRRRVSHRRHTEVRRPNQRLLLSGPAASTFELAAAAGAADPCSRSADVRRQTRARPHLWLLATSAPLAPRASPMLRLALAATIPVALGLFLGGLAATRRGWPWMWTVLGLAAVCGVAYWGHGWEPDSDPVQRFGAPLAIYLPPLSLGGLTLLGFGRSGLSIPRLLAIALGWAAANLFMAQFFFVLGCSGGLWECP